MGKVTLHARIEIGLVTALLLGSCSEASGIVTRDQVIDIADDAVDASGISGKVEELEARVAELEDRADSNDRSIKLLLETGQSELDREGNMADRLRAVEARLGM